MREAICARLIVFIRHENVMRLHRFLGYREEVVVDRCERIDPWVLYRCVTSNHDLYLEDKTPLTSSDTSRAV